MLNGEDMQRPESAEKLPADNAIEMKDVRFAYHDKVVLHGINLRITPGTVNALVGPSGSGKSTIARLIASLWDVKDGSIELGGVDIRTLPLAECTKRIAYVSQDNYLFDLSVMDNIRTGRKGASDEEVVDAAKKCGCHEFIMGLENGYQTVCGASGGHLSGGDAAAHLHCPRHAEGRAYRHSRRGDSLVLLYTTLRLKKSRGGSRQLDGLALDNTQLWLVGFYEVQYPLVLVCKVKFYFNSFFLINANLFYQGNNNTALQMVDILILQKCLQVRVSGSDAV